MLDFHTHVLPYMDDGAASSSESMAMLLKMKKEGVDIVFATSHFYAQEEDPQTFLERREKSLQKLRQRTGDKKMEIPDIYPGAEVLYYPGMGGSETLELLKIEHTPFLLIEMPMMDWTEDMLKEVEMTANVCRCVPVLAHVDRYMRLLRNPGLLDYVRQYKVLIQVNTSYFLRPESRTAALRNLSEGKIHCIGSDCHNMTDRPPDYAKCAKIIRDAGLSQALGRITSNCLDVLKAN